MLERFVINHVSGQRHYPTIGVFFCIAVYVKYAIRVAWHFLTVALQVVAGKKNLCTTILPVPYPIDP